MGVPLDRVGGPAPLAAKGFCRVGPIKPSARRPVKRARGRPLGSRAMLTAHHVLGGIVIAVCALAALWGGLA
jgi:hypothetical protein